MYNNIIQVFTLFMKAFSSWVRHLSQPGGGHGSLTCHMTQLERSDWLGSANFIKIMIEFDDWCYQSITWNTFEKKSIMLHVVTKPKVKFGSDIMQSLPSTHKTLPIACMWGWDMGLFFWFKYLTNVLHMSLPDCMHLTFDCVLTGYEMWVSGPIFSIPLFSPIGHHCQNNSYLLNIILTFDRRHHGSVAVVLVKYEMVQRRFFLKIINYLHEEINMEL